MAPGAPRRRRGHREASGDPPGSPRPDPGRGPENRSKQRRLRESFAIPRLLVNGFATFLVELVRFLGESVVQVLLVGLVTAIGDHILKPLLVATFSSLLQPLLLFLLRLLRGLRDLVDPLMDVLARTCSQLAVLLRALRLVEINLRMDRRTDPGDVGSG